MSGGPKVAMYLRYFSNCQSRISLLKLGYESTNEAFFVDVFNVKPLSLSHPLVGIAAINSSISMKYRASRFIFLFFIFFIFVFIFLLNSTLRVITKNHYKSSLNRLVV